MRKQSFYRIRRSVALLAATVLTGCSSLENWLLKGSDDDYDRMQLHGGVWVDSVMGTLVVESRGNKAPRIISRVWDVGLSKFNLKECLESSPPTPACTAIIPEHYLSQVKVQQKEIDAFVTNHNLKVQQKPENQSASSDANSSVLSGPGWNSVLIGYYSPSCLVVVALDRGEPAIKGDTTADDRLVVFGVEGTPGSCPAGLVQGPPKDMFVKQTPTKPEVNMRREIARR